MNREQVKTIIEALVDKFEHDFNSPIERWDERYPHSERWVPGREDWAVLEAKFGCKFEDSFVHFAELIVDYNCPGTLLVHHNKPSHPFDDCRVDEAWDHEMSLGGWNPAMIPIISLGNGDFYCLRAAGEGRSEVWFHDHEDGQDKRMTNSFADFLERLEWHLNGSE